MIENNTPPSHLSEAFDALFSSAPVGACGTSARPQAAQLDNRADTLTPTSTTKAQTSPESRQISRWRLKHTVANILRDVDSETTPGVCKCGTAGHNSDAVYLTKNGTKAGLRGVFYCDSPWLCPTCAPRRASERADKVLQVFKATEAKRGRVVFLTLTVKHAKGDSLNDLKKLVMDACRKARQGKPWQLAIDRYEIAGVMVGPEVTYSEKHGWHFHLHVALVVLADNDNLAAEAGEWLMERYRSYIAQAGGKTSRQAQDVTVVWREEDLADYISKGSAAWEVSSAGATKDGKKGLTPWDLAARAGRGDAKAARLFQEYAATMPGTRSCVITKGLASKLGIEAAGDEDKPGVDVVPEDQEAEIVGELTPYRWHRVLRNGHAPDVLRVVGAGWDWPSIDAMIATMLKENEPKSEPERRLKHHEPTIEQVASKARHEANFRRGNKGQALQVVITNERDYAAKNGLVYIQPDLKKVLELLSL